MDVACRMSDAANVFKTDGYKTRGFRKARGGHVVARSSFLHQNPGKQKTAASCVHFTRTETTSNELSRQTCVTMRDTTLAISIAAVLGCCATHAFIAPAPAVVRTPGAATSSIHSSVVSGTKSEEKAPPEHIASII